MALVIGTDTYISQTDCSTYLASVYLSTDAKLIAWTALSSADKDTALRKAAKMIDRQPLVGYKSITTQTMEFPRILYTEGGSYDYNLLQYDEWYDPQTVPTAVKNAQCEIALEIGQGTSNNTERMDLRRQGVKSFSLGKLSESYGGAINSLLSEEARQLLLPYTGGGFRVV